MVSFSLSRRFRLGLLTACGLLSAARLSVAQPTTLPNASAAATFTTLPASNDTRNTGADVVHPSSNIQLRAVVQDEFPNSGPKPTAHLRCHYITTQGGAGVFSPSVLIGNGLNALVEDPDVVINRLSGTTLFNILVVYRATPNGGTPGIYCEVWRYNPGPTNTNTLSAIRPPTRVDIADTKAASSPNVDVFNVSPTQCMAVMTYEKDGIIYYRTRVISGPSPGALLPAAGSVALPSGATYAPDVALGLDNDTDTPTAVFVCVDKSVPGKDRIRWIQGPLAGMATGTAVFTSTLAYYAASGHELGAPRVTAAHYFGYGFAAVFSLEQPGSGLNEIHVLSGHPLYGFYSVLVVSSNYNFDNLYYSPVIAPVGAEGNSVMLAWRYLTLGFNNLQGCQVGASSTVYPIYSIDNAPQYGAIRAPSLAAIPGFKAPEHNMFYCWGLIPTTTPVIRFRTSYVDETNYRPAPAASAATVVQLLPNPATADARLALTLSADEQVTAITITELLTGRTVSTAPRLRAAPPTLPLADLVPAGLRAGQYVARVTTTRGVYTERFQYAP